MDRLQSMRVFERVAAEGGFAAAARSLDLSAPVVTRLVADLEEHLGTRLLQRTTRRLALTDAGETYLARVRNILQDIDEAHALARAHTQELTGLLRVHAPPVLASNMLGPLLGPFRARYPGIVVDIDVAALSTPPIEEFDLTLMTAGEDFNADVVARKIVESYAILVASPAYLKQRGTPRTPQELAGHDGLKLRRPDGRTRPWRMWRAQGGEAPVEVDVPACLVINHTDTLLRAAAGGAGITSTPIDLVAPLLASGELVRVLSPWILGVPAVYAALPSRKFVPQRTRVFLDFLIERMREQGRVALEACEAC